ncbi:MAG: hypothetical protein R2941_17395 [Desulfobacterales bacterium]
MICENCGYAESASLLTIKRNGKTLSVCPSCYAPDGKRTEEPEFGWYGAGFAVGKGEYIPPGFVPPLDDSKAWQEFLAGFAHAHADYPDDEAQAGILEGDFTKGEPFDSMLLRILKFPLYEKITKWID